MMYRVILSWSVILGVGLAGSAQTEQTFEFGGVERTFYLDLPADLTTGAPLVFVLHGYTSSASVIRNYSGWPIISDNAGVAVCYPQGTLDNNGISHWNANFTNSTTDDHGFLVALAQHLQETYNLSPDCTYSCGMSNGGYMSYSLACQYPNVFKAVGAVAGAMSDYDFDNCNPEEVIPIIHVHGTVDSVVDYNNGDLGPWGNEGIPDIIDLWTGIMGTTDEEQTTLPNLQVIDLSSVDFFRYFGAPEGKEFHHYRVNGGGHTWFGAWGNQDIESTELLWNFFQSHCVGDFTSVEEAPRPEAQLVQWTVDGLRVLTKCQVRAVDLQGRIVWNWSNAHAGLLLPRGQSVGTLLIQAIAPDGAVQVLRVW